ncbi:unnamed protein product [Diabrotica balteata]|uniref:Uncharacterized protein n=1 Tax=Diabrotica balteata TaxID=107213 RepID=A0A9N9XHD3_DIABA|nr:unnamed protein product [Diabrotica balteata]
MGQGTPPVDGRGKHVIRPNKLPVGTDDKIRQHLLSYPRYKSHYSLKDNLQHYYLSPLLNIAKMHHMYLEQYEPEQLLLQNENMKAILKFEYYRNIFTENFKISFGKPNCQKSNKLQNQINAADNDDQKRALETEKKLHITKAETFYQDMKEKTDLAKNDLQTHFQQFFMKNPSRKNNQFTISKYRVMQYEKLDRLDSEMMFKCSETVNFIVFNTSEIRDKRNLQLLTLPNHDHKLYTEIRKLVRAES